MTTTASQPKLPAKRGVAPIWLILFTILFIMAAAIISFVVFQPILVLPRITLAPGFALTDQNGSQISNEDLRGQIVLYNFTYTNCEECAQTDEVMAQVQNRLDEVATEDIPIKLVTISVDPEHDTPDVLTEYAQSLGANPDQWVFATGSPAMLKSVIGGGFSLFYQQREDGAFDLDPGFMLIDGNGIMRAEYRTAVPEIDIMLRDIGLLVEEAQNSNGAAKIGYEAAHLFLCYPPR